MAFIAKATWIILMLLANSTHAAASKIETRCGWFDNPTPGNAWLHDKDGQWTIAVQGRYEAKGNWNPDFDLDDETKFVRIQASYGYGCVCMKAEFNRKEMKVVRVTSARIKKLKDCRRDKVLKEPVNGEGE